MIMLLVSIFGGGGMIVLEGLTFLRVQVPTCYMAILAMATHLLWLCPGRGMLPTYHPQVLMMPWLRHAPRYLSPPGYVMPWLWYVPAAYHPNTPLHITPRCT